jgi:hypothetical protein
MGRMFFSSSGKNILTEKRLRLIHARSRFQKMMTTREVKRKRNSMLTNRTNRFEMHAATTRNLWALVGMPGASSSVYCLGSIPTGFSIGGGLLQEAELNSLQAKFDSRQLQM